MRIQHNIPAMNAYGNYNKNTKALQLNLQKLSSGYKINKAGDDAAGLAISEKMRAQITGLEVAQKNAKDGISLVQTAEGALTEVHTMLNRMYSLAEQSANGTYDEKVDREQLQKEVQSLSDEIDRIADATNFNGQKLLDGKLAGSGSADKLTVTTKADAAAVAEQPATETKGITDTTLSAANQAGKLLATIAYQDESGANKTLTVTLTSNSDGKKLFRDDGTEAASDTSALTATKVGTALANELNKSDLKDAFTFADDGAGKIKYTANEKGSGGPQILSFTIENATNSTAQHISVDFTDTTNNKSGADAYDRLDVSKVKVSDGTTEDDIAKNTINVGDKKFLLVDKDATNATLAALQEKGIIGIVSGQSAAAGGNNADAVLLAQKISNEFGISVTKPTGTTVDIRDTNGKKAAGGGGGLTLQIGDTSDSYNKMTVSINDCHAKAIGIGSVDISKQEGASTAMTSIKNAINYISDVRGTLGSLQNRLDHTINNLSVQQENIQDAEATIRDVDVANEMMAYTKNNILVQSAQAMLAQANQLPQGVLQLLG